jgi:hypothetical protein
VALHWSPRWDLSGPYGSAPDTFKAAADDACVMDGMSGVAVAEVILDQPEIVAPIRECEATGVSQHVRMNRRQSGALCRGRDQVIDGLTSERLAALGYEKPGKLSEGVSRS